MVQLCYACCADEASTERHIQDAGCSSLDQKGNGCIAGMGEAAGINKSPLRPPDVTALENCAVTQLLR